MTAGRDDGRQISGVVRLLQSVFHPALAGVCLHGSAVAHGLRAQSDIDMLAIIEGTMTDAQRDHLLSGLLEMSGRHPAPPDGPRSLEVMVFARADLSAGLFPVRVQFTYGEWLRGCFEAGSCPAPVADPDNTLVLAQARLASRPLLGPPLSEFLPAIAAEHVRIAIGEALPALVGGLCGDERNVLLTLARMWRTAAQGDFVSKDTAAAWAAPQLPEPASQALAHARAAYLGEVEEGDWRSRQAQAREAASHMRQRILAQLQHPAEDLPRT
ncbi:aminoglycoside adenylyltransferase domain-containing protein [Xanthobacter sp. TB0136]|uniref:aminoglycoside adenylyltransferase domain-containing protein n=1 Tax=Xanthobacter sp. TB0136 TaxID=3459177 RepID=UPI0040394E23